MSEKNDVSRLFEDAGKYGNITPEVLAVLKRAGVDRKIKANTGLSVIPIESSDVILVAVLIDDSQSIDFHHNAEAVVKGHNEVIKALRGSRQKFNILFRTQYLNGKVLNDWVRLKDAQEMTLDNYRRDGMTPLWDSSVVLLGSVLAEVQKARQMGKNARSASLIVADGKDEPFDKEPEECNAEDVSVLVRHMLRNNTDEYAEHTVSFMGIQDGETDYKAVAKSMGIGLGEEEDRWIITPDNYSFEIRRAFYTFSKEVSHAIRRLGGQDISQRAFPPVPLDTRVLDDED